MPELDLEPPDYRTVVPPKASRLNAAIVLLGAIGCFAAIYFGSAPNPRETILLAFGALVGLAGGWAMTRLISPKAYIPEDDPERLKNPVPKTAVGRFFARPAGWDAPGKWLPRLLTALILGLGYWWLRSHH